MYFYVALDVLKTLVMIKCIQLKGKTCTWGDIKAISDQECTRSVKRHGWGTTMKTLKKKCAPLSSYTSPQVKTGMVHRIQGYHQIFSSFWGELTP